MTDSNRRMTHAALVAALIASPVFAASDPAAIEQQLDALQQALARQQEQLAQQQQEIERLRQQLDARLPAELPSSRLLTRYSRRSWLHRTRRAPQ